MKSPKTSSSGFFYSRHFKKFPETALLFVPNGMKCYAFILVLMI